MDDLGGTPISGNLHIHHGASDSCLAKSGLLQTRNDLFGQDLPSGNLR